VKYRLIARQRLGKNIPAEVYARNNRTSTARQKISKQVFSTIEGLCFLRVPCGGVIKGQRNLFDSVVRNWVEFWRWQSKVIEKNGEKGIRLCKEDFMYAAVTVRLV
jgi:hypothetical protein